MKTSEEKRELRSLYNFYKNTERGFVTRDGYAVIPSNGKKVGVVYEGEILKFCRNEDSAHNFIAQHRKTIKKLSQKSGKK